MLPGDAGLGPVAFAGGGEPGAGRAPGVDGIVAFAGKLPDGADCGARPDRCICASRDGAPPGA